MMNDSEFYQLVSKDSMSWLDNSEKLKFSGDIILQELQIRINPFLDGICDYSNEEEIMGLWNSYFLLIGFALENLIKGLSVEKHREAIDYTEIFQSYWQQHAKGHGISNIAKDNIDNLTDEEIAILEKLEIYLVWAGRYPTAQTQNRYIKEVNNLNYKSRDPEIINSMFLKIKEKLVEEWEKNEYSQNG